MGLRQVIELTNDFCYVLTQIERGGIHIDLKALDQLEVGTQARCDALHAEMQLMAQDAMGDTPINLNSNEQMSMLLFSRGVKDKGAWATEIGFYTNQNKFEKLRLTQQMSLKRFVWLVQNNMRVLYKTKKIVCGECKGTGKSVSNKTNRKINCPTCKATGVDYHNTERVAGFRVTPKKDYLSNNGFASSNDVIEEILKDKKLNDKAKRFLTMLNEYRKLNNYLSTSIGGIRRGLVGATLHGNFNQSITATGRLSSSNPNLQNFPRGSTFPIKKVFTSRFKDGIIADADMSQLEFRAAAELAGDNKAIQDIINGIDIHMLSADALGISRQEAKAETFAPLYGASRDWGLMERYPTLKKWHTSLIDEAVRKKSITLPTGRVYYFPNIKRTSYGCSQQTKVKNYPVQGFATADIVPAIIIELYNELIEYESYICSTIHDSVIIDIKPEEYKEVIKIVHDVMNDGKGIMKRRFDIDITVPLAAEIKVGANGYDTKKITLKEINND